jgi:hypothetical protein
MRQHPNNVLVAIALWPAVGFQLTVPAGGSLIQSGYWAKERVVYATTAGTPAYVRQTHCKEYSDLKSLQAATTAGTERHDRLRFGLA